MCAQCNSKKTHIHTAKSVSGSANTVTVQNAVAADCCSSTSTASSCCSAETCDSGGDGGDDGGARSASSSTIKPAFKVFSSANAAQPQSAVLSSSLDMSNCQQAVVAGPDTHHHSQENVQSAGCCSSGRCSSGSKDQEIEDDTAISGHRQRWSVLGMDCPACAAKLEKAVMGIAGVKHAKVMFATEKLVVTTASPMAAVIEQKVIETGFRLVGANGRPDEEKQSFFQQHMALITIALMMAVSFVIDRQSEFYGLIAFSATTILGLIPIVKKAWTLAKSGSPFSIETLMSVAALGALYLGETAEAAMVLLLFLLGEQLEGYAASRARSGVKALMDLVPEEATVIKPNGERQKVAVNSLQKGDVIEVAPGARLPADAIVRDIAASFDESALTGESVPVERLPGEKVMAGSLVADKVVQLTIESEQGDNAIDRILHLIEEAESRKAPLERFLDRFSRWYTPAMIVLATLVIVTPPLFFAQSWDEWLYRGLTLLLIACPCALVISTPAAITSGLAAAAKRGALIKGGAALEQLGHIKTVAFDKTGTLTEGKPVMTDLISWQGDETTLLRQAAAVEAGSLHPLAVAVVKAAQAKNISVTEANHREAIVGKGIQGEIDGITLALYAADRLPQAVTLTAEQQNAVNELESQGKTLVVALRDEQAVGVIAWRDNLRDDSAQAIQQLKAMGVSSVMLTGDNPRAAQAIASDIGIDFRAGLLPADKVSAVREMNDIHNVAMVGDGINDAPAMKTASIGIAMGGGTDVALETADAALTHNRVSELPTMIALSRATLLNIRQNIFLALGLKGVFLVTTLLGMTGLWVAVLADSGATALVTLNALRLLRFNPDK
ncbi:zinc/cadmium/mercury/lead-transporting ATPase [Photobacterium jeanii]|uniref:P-type Zn(2+) transporter n=1 Tax=Photobacterium jeanii TaxID=858640 RepID=A0A178KLX9_9GAMM|nr:zinc/cadmium/mercury/lead-transporting ATPase [Photobacterium jeanii]OAN18277.1 zinc/cadmium/mercury/lead-transporting ATPase [Photobacterium jeanii]PST92044.1 zinc/cadmium/mercury/lead-transporting ATPase [Photobacterium jeanii]